MCGWILLWFRGEQGWESQFFGVYLPYAVLVAAVNYVFACCCHYWGRRGIWLLCSLSLYPGMALLLLFDLFVALLPPLLLPVFQQTRPGEAHVAKSLMAGAGFMTIALAFWVDCMKLGYRYINLDKDSQTIVSVDKQHTYKVSSEINPGSAIKAELDWLRTMQQQMWWGYGAAVIAFAAFAASLDKSTSFFGVHPSSADILWLASALLFILLAFHSLVAVPVVKIHNCLMDALHESEKS